MQASTTITLPSGIWVGGVHHRQASLRPLTGEVEAFIAETGSDWLPAERTTAVLGRCLTRLGSLNLENEEPQALARQLTTGDREALLLHLRRLTLGERIPGVLNCPYPDCGQPMDLTLRASDLLLPPYAQPQPEYQATVQQDGSAWRVRFRLPTGGDQEDAARLAGRQMEAGERLLASRCLLEITADQAGGAAIRIADEPPEEVTAALPLLLSERDPQAEVQLELTCPSCGRAFSAVFDAASYFFREIDSRSTRLYRQVHLLALYYHWSEAEIMSMTLVKRQRYLGLLEESLGEAGRHG